MRRTLLVGTLVLLAVGTLAGRHAERFANRVVDDAGASPSPRARALHASTMVADLHADPLLWGRDLTERATIGHVDLPRLRVGGVGLQVFGLVTKVPLGANIDRTDARWPDVVTLLAFTHGWPRRTWTSVLERALSQVARFDQAVHDAAGALLPVRTRADLARLTERRLRDPDVVGGLLAIEGAHALEGDPANLARVFEAGVRMVGLAHFFDNAFAGSAHGVVKGGLTAKGRTLVAEMVRRGMVVDLAHASPATIDDTLAVLDVPVVVSHTGVRATCDNARNLSDEQVRAIAAGGGVIGVGMWETAVCGTAPADVARAVAHIVGLVGAGHAALGGDFDGAVTTGFDATALPRVTEALLAAGLSEPTVRAVLGENVLRVLATTLPQE